MKANIHEESGRRHGKSYIESYLCLVRSTTGIIILRTIILYESSSPPFFDDLEMNMKVKDLPIGKLLGGLLTAESQPGLAEHDVPT